MACISQGPSNAFAPATLEEFVPGVYKELTRIAVSLLRGHRKEPLMEPSDLVHEAYLRLALQGPDHYVSRGQFFCVAVRQMRRILVDHVRARTARKRGGDWTQVSLDRLHVIATADPNVIAIDTAIAHLASTDPQLGQVAKLRLFEDSSSKEIAKACSMGESTARKKWSCARARLRDDLAETYANPVRYR